MIKNKTALTLAGGAIFGLGVLTGSVTQLTGVAAAQSADRVFELRTYTANPGHLAELSARPVPVIASAAATASELAELLAARAQATSRSAPGQLTLLVTDMPKRFSEVAARFLGRSLEGLDVRAVDL